MRNLAPIFMTLAVVIAFARFVGFLFRKIGQPPVMGEVLGGILLGPSFLGNLFPNACAYFFHPGALTFLKSIADAGIVLYLFLLGLEIDLPRLRTTARSAILISQLSIVVPLLLGTVLAHFIYPHYAPPSISVLPFSLFVGVALSITAFPVLARILADSSLHKTRIGELALTCAAIDDLTAWCLVSIVVGIASTPDGFVISIAFKFILMLVYIFAIVVFVRRMLVNLVPRLERKFESRGEVLLAFAVIGALVSATISELVGIHALFGAFLFGVIIPHESNIARDLNDRLQDFVKILFLPAFFALTGLKTQIGLIASGPDFLICACIVGVAIAGKFGGAFAGAILAGHTRKESALIGVLMNTRGLVELIVLNIGLSLGVLTPTLFAMFVVMALFTTFMTGPLLRIQEKNVIKLASSS